MFLDQIVVLKLFETMFAKFNTQLRESFFNSLILAYMLRTKTFILKLLPEIFIKIETILPNSKCSLKIISVLINSNN